MKTALRYLLITLKVLGSILLAFITIQILRAPVWPLRIAVLCILAIIVSAKWDNRYTTWVTILAIIVFGVVSYIETNRGTTMAGPNLEAHKYPEVERMKTKLRKLIAPQTSYTDTKKRMEDMGFKCEVITVNYSSTNGVMVKNPGPATFLQCIENNPQYGSTNRWTLRFSFSRDYLHDYVHYIEGTSPNGGRLYLVPGY